MLATNSENLLVTIAPGITKCSRADPWSLLHQCRSLLCRNQKHGVFVSQNFLLFCFLLTLNLRPSQSILIRPMEVGFLRCPYRVGPP